MICTQANVEEQKDNGLYTDTDMMARFRQEQDVVKSLIIWLRGIEGGVSGNWQSDILPLLLKAVTEIDELINTQVSLILQHDALQKLEAGWRGLLYLADQADSHDSEQRVKIKMLPLSWAELSKDIDRAMDFDQSEYFKKIYSAEYDMPGGEPFGLLVGDYRISHIMRGGAQDMAILKEVARTSAAAFAPFITGAHASLFGVDYFSELSQTGELRQHFSQAEFANWQSLRDMEDARFLGIVAPGILMRAPYGDDGRRKESFVFREKITNPEQGCLWGNAAYALAAVMIRAFAESGWFAQIRGVRAGRINHGLVTGLPAVSSRTEVYRSRPRPPVNLVIGEKLEAEMADCGFIPLSAIPYSAHLAFFSNASVQKAAVYESAAATINAKLSVMLQYIMCVSRFAHYVKVMGRRKVGRYESPEACEADLQRWLHGYTSGSDEASDEVRARYPLHAARIKVKELRGQPGKYFSVIQLQPHFQLDQMVSTIRLVAELSPKNQISM